MSTTSVQPPITSRANLLFRELLALAEQPRARRELRRTLLDGEHLLAEALAAGLLPERLIHRPDYDITSWRERLPGVPVTTLSPGLLQALSPVRQASGLLAVLPIPILPAAETGDVVLLEAIQDPGNLGAILRTAAAAGVTSVWLSPGCAEAWSPKALRGGQGAQFRLHIREQVDLADSLAQRVGPVYAATLGAARSLYDLDLCGPVHFAFGNEGAGLSTGLVACAAPFAIPMPGKTESLNVAAAAAVCLFEMVRQRKIGVPENSC